MSRHIEFRLFVCNPFRPKGVVPVTQLGFSADRIFCGPHKNISKFAPSKKSLVPVDSATRFLDMTDQHAISPKPVLVLEARWLADNCSNDVGPNDADARDRHQITDWSVLFFIFFKKVFVFFFLFFQKLNLSKKILRNKFCRWIFQFPDS